MKTKKIQYLYPKIIGCLLGVSLAPVLALTCASGEINITDAEELYNGQTMALEGCYKYIAWYNSHPKCSDCCVDNEVNPTVFYCDTTA
jgi:hypothetical protein